MGKRIVMLTTSPLPYGDSITDGPGYRAWHLLSHLARKHEVAVLSLYESFHLGIKKECEVVENDIRVKCVPAKPKIIADLIEQGNPDVLYLPCLSTPFLSRLKRKIPTVLDYTGSGLLEEYVSRGRVPVTLLEMKLKSFWLGDFFVASGERERYYLLGLMVASRKLSRGKHGRSDPLIHVIPMTPPLEPPVLREKAFQRKPEDFVLLVAGAFLPWYDYAAFFEALKLLQGKGVRNVKAVFMGGNPRDKKFERRVRLMAETPEIRDNVMFAGLVPFKDRANYYLLADAAVNIPPSTVEDELSVRTRVVDYVWAGLPLITPARDEYSGTVVAGGGGFKYEAGDSSSLCEVIEKLINDKQALQQAKSRLKGLLESEFEIEKFISPLKKFIEKPYVDSERSSTSRISSDVFLWLRDVANLIKH